IQRGMYRLERIEAEGARDAPRPQLFGSGPILQEVRRAAGLLAERFGLSSDIWSVTSYCQLRRDALAAERFNGLHPDETPRGCHLQESLRDVRGPFIAATDDMRAVPDQIARWVPGRFFTLGTDGFGRSDTEAALRRHFEVDAECIAYTTLRALADEDQYDRKTLWEALKTLDIDPEKMDPATA
ncbi:MAG: transketolase-like TK C-terminal-containing protein, partial [Planctomycetaceae bacterium]